MEKSKKEQIREYFENIMQTLPKAIDEQIEAAGGENMLLLRIDILHWVYFSREELARAREVLRFLNGEKDIDRNHIEAAIRHSCFRHQNAVGEIIRLKEDLAKKEKQLREYEEQAPYYKLTAEVLEEELEMKDETISYVPEAF